MYRHLVFCKPSKEKVESVLSEFNLKNTLVNDRTQIWENDDIAFSIDSKVVRVFLYNGNDIKIINYIKGLFYGDK